LAHETDLNLGSGDISGLTSPDALGGILTRLGYQTASRAELTPEAIGLAGDSAAAVKRLELLSEDAEGFLRVLFVQLRSLTAKSRTDLARVLGRTNVDHLLILASDFEALEFVLLDKRSREAQRPGGLPGIKVVPLVYAVNRRDPDRLALRFLRRLTWTCRDALDQFDKLRSVFTAAAFTEEYFQNRALFADHFLLTRVREDPAWQENPTNAFLTVKDLLREAPGRLAKQAEKATRSQIIEPIFQLLGFKTQPRKGAEDDQTVPDYDLLSPGGDRLSAAFVYRWDRWLDGPDIRDTDTPDENPGACVVSALEAGEADWIIVTNGRQWRLYSRRAHSRATNFYEVDLSEALIASGDTDPNEAFRYWWLFFRRQAFAPEKPCSLVVPPSGGSSLEPPEGGTTSQPQCWLDLLQEGSHDYAKQLGERLKERVFVTIFPHLAQGFLEDRRASLGLRTPPTDEELRDTFEATLTLLYRLLFLLYAESRDLLPIREAPYYEASLKKIKGEIAEKAGIAESEAGARLRKAYSACETTLYDRLSRLFQAMDQGDPSLNVPVYNGGLFLTDQRLETRDQRPETGNQRVETDDQRPQTADQRPESRESRIAQFLLHHKIPDRFLALAIDLLARDEDEKTFSLVFIDYKSLEVRHLGSIYEGLLEFKLKIAEEDLTTQTEDKKEKFIPLSQAKPRRGRAAEIVVRKGEVYLSNEKAERKATGSYYTPDPIVRYIVRNAVGPVLAERLESLRAEFRNVRKTFNRELEKVKAYPVKTPKGEPVDPREFAQEKTYAAHKELVEKLFDFRVLDPAMGSGHFLVEAVDFITDRVLHFLNQFPVNPVSFMLEKTRRNILQALAEQGVTADPAKLTDVNLLKRHVLKRCIYGVDLNPMAVELAKVSLWLDAFTLGAPLSFLDHHLRCGNSLIGATFKDLEEATKGQLFGIDYEPLLRAINHVLLVNRMSDATAAEARQSASEYDLARRALSGYQIVLDLLVAKHFGYPEAPDLISRGKGLDLTSRERLFGSLLNEKEQRLVEAVERLARQPDRRFFHWETEFPEVFFAVADADHRQIKHKDRLPAGTAGFDAVVGNPPYDELSEHAAGKELPEKAYFKEIALYRDALGGRLNVFRPFVLRSLGVLREGGRHSFIVPMALLADQFTSALRKRLLVDGYLRSVAAFPQKDDPHNRVFFEAKLSTCVFVTEKRSEPGGEIHIETYPGKSFLDLPKRCAISLAELRRLDPENLSLPAISQEEILRWKAIQFHPKVTRWSEVAKCYLGELMTNASNAHNGYPLDSRYHNR
jgi:hypothetical protein